MEDSCLFISESAFSDSKDKSGTSWKVLSVEDDLNYQQSLLYGLSDLVVQGQPVEILTANSAVAAAEMLVKHDDIAVILLDVVMERDDAGLRLVDTIRNVQGNEAVRIILLTGQPGSAPRQSVMQEYDIDEYWNKSEVNHDQLSTVISAHLRTWQTLRELKQGYLGLQMVVDAARSLSSKYDFDSFTQVVLSEIGRVVGVNTKGIVCVIQHVNDNPSEIKQAKIVAASGSSINLIGQDFNIESQGLFGKICKQALESQTHQFDQNFSALYFKGDGKLADHFLILVNNDTPLSGFHINLLNLFSENINSGFTKISLISRLNQLAYQDSVLKIHNQNWLQRELANMTEEDKKNSELLILNVNHFASNVLIFGEEHAMDIIKQLYFTIKSMSSDNSFIARVGTDAFVILCVKGDALDKQSLYSLIDQPVMVRDIPHSLELTIARMDMQLLIGIPHEKILYLGLSLLQIAHQECHSIIEYNPDHFIDITAESILMNQLREAISNNELSIVLQPKIDMINDVVVGFESLLRWKKQGQFISPQVFIPIAEQSGLINQLDSFVFEQTLNAIEVLNVAGYKLPISFNATCTDLKNQTYLDMIVHAITERNIDPELLELEITESQAMLDYDQMNPILMKLRQLGLNIALDDFGTGYSSLSHVSRLAATCIKIDRSFVMNIENDKASSHVVDMIMKLADQFSFTVIAEGIETTKQKEIVLQRGCRYGQGYLFSKPMPLADIISWLNKKASRN
ncbi:EAL domain-containing protein [Vibrio sp. MA40-2]|uniref:EAL domain-containing protein n=1 Tax=Vibrio sp. MA40-2 TaxID=3391828 RepID=UPI0039A5CFE8